MSNSLISSIEIRLDPHIVWIYLYQEHTQQIQASTCAGVFLGYIDPRIFNYVIIMWSQNVRYQFQELTTQQNGDPQDSHHENEQFRFCTLKALWHYSVRLAGLPKPRTVLSNVALLSLPYTWNLSVAPGTFKQLNSLLRDCAFFLCTFNCFSHVLSSAGTSVAFSWVFSHSWNWNQNSNHILGVKWPAAGLFYPPEETYIASM